MRYLSMYSGWEKVKKLSAYQQIPASTILFRQGAEARSATLVESGLIKLVRLEEDGQERIIALYLPGSLLGAETLISNQQHAATAMTLTDCQLHSIPAPAFVNLVRTDPQFSWQLQQAFSQRINAQDISSSRSRSVPSRSRLEQLLWQLLCVQNQDEPDANAEWWLRESKLFLPLQLQELAQMIAVTPEYLSRLLGKMETDGVIRRDNGRLIVTCPQKLQHASEQTSTSFNLAQPDAINSQDIIVV